MLAFSYTRWSSEKQSKGDSLRRQTETAQKWALRHNVPLDTSTYQDHGISAYKGRNRHEGKLGAFLQAIDEGRVQTPCYLIVEALDRITREEIDIALELFLSIVKRGVTIVTVLDDQVFSKETIRRDHGISLIIAISKLIQGHTDSYKRAERIREKFEELKRQGVKVLTRAPTWLIPTEDRRDLKPDSKLAKLINRIFDMAIDGYGQREIANALNAENVPTLLDYRPPKRPSEAKAKKQRRWTQGTVSNILDNPAVYGRRERTNEDDFWRPIMSKKKFMTARDAVKGRSHKGATRKGVPNIFTGVSYCAHCGSRMKYIHVSRGSPYLRCRRALDEHTCKGKLYPYRACEIGFLDIMSSNLGLSISSEFIVEQAAIVPALRGEIDSLKQRQRQLLKLADMAAGVEVVAQELNSLQKQISDLEAQLEQHNHQPISRNEVDSHMELFDYFLKISEPAIRKLAPFYTNIEVKDGDVEEMRRKIKVSIARLCARIEFDVGKGGLAPLIRVTPVDGKVIVVPVRNYWTTEARATHLRKNLVPSMAKARRYRREVKRGAKAA